MGEGLQPNTESTNSKSSAEHVIYINLLFNMGPPMLLESLHSGAEGGHAQLVHDFFSALDTILL